MWESRRGGGRRAGISNGCGKVRGWKGGGPELSIPGQLPQPGRGKASATTRSFKPERRRPPRWICWSSRTCLASMGSAGAACGSARALPDLCAALRGAPPEPPEGLQEAPAEPRGLPGPNPAAPTPFPPLRISSLANGGFRETERNLDFVSGNVIRLRSPLPPGPSVPD